MKRKTHRGSHTQPEEGTTHTKTKNKKQTCTTNNNNTGRQVQVCYMPRYATLRKQEKHNDNHANKGNQEV